LSSTLAPQSLVANKKRKRRKLIRHRVYRWSEIKKRR